ncbi:MAG: glycosyltransferase family 9 protein [Candidatus Marinimicrobia bacterium]|nr:glycosyltransferase family 9 protein [Candidatus Neomarinimicrobiota bacterium]
MIIECYRAGAIGDVLMTTPAVRALKNKYKGSYIRYVTVTPNLILNNPYVDEISPVGLDADLKVYFEYPLKKGYPDKPLEKHLVYEFAECANVKVDSLRGDLRLYKHEISFAENAVKKFRRINIKLATIHITAGWSPYKEWEIDLWQKVVDYFKGRVLFIQLGSSGQPVLKNVLSFVGILSVRLSASMTYVSDFHVGVDSFPNHVAAAFNKPAVVLFGSTSPVGFGYNSAINIWKGYECSPCYREYNKKSLHPKPPCPYGKKCMRDISLDEVINSIETILRRI